MKSIMFSFGDSATEASQDQARAEILGMPGVRNVGRISPEANKPALRRMWYAEVDDESADAIVRRLRSKSEIQSADFPALRRLV
ncbi:MAG: hypothetical protein JO163_14155 [Methylobacteriaceae bacterium]|nr:hypothetical protein [Methylobacteriaceae bacterium]MBV9703868.1 hypothetical protein [Methylobacteriaceae bacterium]